MSQIEKTTKEKLLEEFDKTILEPLDKKDWGICPSQILAIKQFFSQAIAQTREETIREEIKYWINVFDNRPKDRDLESDNIAQNFARIEIERLKSLINK